MRADADRRVRAYRLGPVWEYRAIADKWYVDGQGRVEHRPRPRDRHPAFTKYIRSMGQSVKLGYECPRCREGFTFDDAVPSP